MCAVSCFVGVCNVTTQPFEWTDECAAVFAPVLAYTDLRQPFIVDTNARNTGVGAMLSEEDDNKERVIAYYSCTSTQTAGRCARPLPLPVLRAGHLLPSTHQPCLPHLAVEL